MPEWLIERGIGETRCALVEDGEIIEARVRRKGITPAGTITDARLIAVAPRVTVEADGEQFLLPRAASGVSEGRSVRIEVTREALGGVESWKRGLARVTSEAPRPAPPIAEGRDASIPGWDDLLDEARSGIIRFEGGELRIEPTAAMTAIDIDGWLVPDKLAQMAAWAVAKAIRRLDLAGSIVVDFPTLAAKDQRREIDGILEDYLPRPFEKTAINGFGLVQIVRPRARPSLVDLARDRAAFEARALLRRASGHVGSATLTAHPVVIAALKPEWIGQFERQIGGRTDLRADPSLAMSAGHVH